MCNEYQLRLPFEPGRFSQIKIPITFGEAASNRPVDRPFRPTNRAPVIRAVDPLDPSAGLEAMERRWWMVPFFHKGKVSDWKAMCTNARLETPPPRSANPTSAAAP